MRYFLTGLPGSGKSFWAKKLAEKYQLPFLDLDAHIEVKETKSITDIFKEKGEVYFRELESEALQEIIIENEQLILACGGGTPCFHQNMERMNTAGTTIFLNTPPEWIAKNLMTHEEIEQRPLFAGLKSQDQVIAHLNHLLTGRIEYYKKARYEVVPGAFEVTLNDFDKIIVP
ncbi:shikimate kinase [Marivirga sp. S37H4]|uniref:Shikimate kinase n=1 Tax=Marivirga aurantiaca TaxID=2802615 RepID=A0A935C7U2_9BACT|nr:shikimate kinase [Marivirga aurantiaca]MBK6264567.1 shikimate kinase [Marivirga aurantiaca]